MATEEDLKKAEDGEDESSRGVRSRRRRDSRARRRRRGDEVDGRRERPSRDRRGRRRRGRGGSPVQLGYQRYVYAAYMAGALLVGVPRREDRPRSVVPPRPVEARARRAEGRAPLPGRWRSSASSSRVYYWRKPEARQYANEVAEELSKVTWPSRKEVTNSTTVVVLTTVFATVFFALMDRFWGFITDKIYTF